MSLGSRRHQTATEETWATPQPGPSASEASNDSRAEDLDARLDTLIGSYLETLSLIERLHRLLLDVIKDDFERVGLEDVNGVQALLLFNIGTEELTASDLRNRGYYQGSNVSYNLKKLVAGGYLHHKRCSADRRAVRISLTPKGRKVRDLIADIYQRHAASFLAGAVGDPSSFDAMNQSMRRLERFWRGQIRYIY